MKNKNIDFPLDIGSERYTFSFTIRDSAAHFVNVASWGNEDYVRALSDSFRVGACGELSLILKPFFLQSYSHDVFVVATLKESK